MAIEHSFSGRVMEAIPFYKRAVELDPELRPRLQRAVHRCTGPLADQDWPLSMRKRAMRSGIG